MIIVISKITISCNIFNNTIIDINITKTIIIPKVSISHNINIGIFVISIIIIIITLQVILNYWFLAILIFEFSSDNIIIQIIDISMDNNNIIIITNNITKQNTSSDIYIFLDISIIIIISIIN